MKGSSQHLFISPLRYRLFYLSFFFLLFFVVTPFLSHVLFSWEGLHSFSSLQSLLIQYSLSSSLTLFAFLSFLQLCSRESRISLLGASCFFDRRKFVRGIYYGVFGYPLFLFFHSSMSAFITFITKSSLPSQSVVTLVEKSMLSDSSWAFYISSITLIIVAPMVEEILFRGVLENFLRAWTQPLYAALFSSSLFSCLHYSYEQGISNYVIIGTLFFFGLTSSYIRQKEGHLMSSIGFHSAFNALSLTLCIIRHIMDI